MKPFARVALVALSATLCISHVPLHAANGNDDGSPSPTFNGVSLSVQNATVPPGGMFQFQLMITEPKPISTSSTRPTTSTSTSGIALYDPLGITAGVAVLNGSGLQITATSPTGTFGNSPDPDYPLLTITAPIPANAVVGTRYSLGVDLGNSFFLDATGQAYPTEIKTGTLTIGGTMAISDVIPGGGFQPAGTRIRILGMGFTPASGVDFSGVTLAASDYQFVSPGGMDVVLPQGLTMDGTRVRVKNELGERSTYFSYLRAHVMGQSTNLLVSQSEPLFSRQTYTAATLNWRRSGTTFTALAVQNPSVTSTQVTINLLSATNQVLASLTLPLDAYSKMTRDLMELFPQTPDSAVAVQITCPQKIQVLGLLGDVSSDSVVPVIATGN